MPNVNTTEVRKLREKWAAAELDTAILERIDDAWSRYQAIGDELRACTDNAATGRGTITGHVAAGTITVAEAVERERAEAVRPTDRNTAQTIAASARARLLNDLVADLRTRDLATLVNAAVGQVVDEAAKLAPAIDNAADAVAAMRGDKRCRDSWATLTNLHDRYRALVIVGNALTRLKVATPGVPGIPKHVIKPAEFNALAPARQIALIATAPPPSDEWLEQQANIVSAPSYEKPTHLQVGA